MPLLIQRFLNEFNGINNKSVKAVDAEAMQILERTPGRATSASSATSSSARPSSRMGTSIAAGAICRRPLVSRGETLPTITLTPGTTVDEAERG